MILLVPFLTLAHAWSQETTKGLFQPRHATSLVAMNDTLFLIGAQGEEQKNVAAFTIGQSDQYNWKMMSLTPISMHHAQAVSVKDRILIAGAFSGDFPHEKPVPHVWWFFPLRNHWMRGVEIPIDRQRGSAGAVLTSDNNLFLVGGIKNGHMDGFVPYLDLLDLSTSKWEVLPDAPHARDHFQAALFENRKVVCAGGRTTHFRIGKLFELTVAPVDVFDISAGDWQTIAPIPTPRAGAMTVLRNSEMFVMGGESSQPQAHDEVEVLDVSTSTWRRAGRLESGRHAGGAAIVNDITYIVAGCGTHGGDLEYDTVETIRLI